MAVHIATPAEIGGSLDPDEIKVLHVSGPFTGMVLVNKKNDATLAAAVAAHEIVVEGPALAPPQPPAVPTPTVTSVTPPSGTLASLKPGPTEITVTGTGFIDGTTTVVMTGVAVSSVTVSSPTTVVFDADLSGKTAAGDVPFTVSNGAGKTATSKFTITA